MSNFHLNVAHNSYDYNNQTQYSNPNITVPVQTYHQLFSNQNIPNSRNNQINQINPLNIHQNCHLSNINMSPNYKTNQLSNSPSISLTNSNSDSICDYSNSNISSVNTNTTNVHNDILTFESKKSHNNLLNNINNPEFLKDFSLLLMKHDISNQLLGGNCNKNADIDVPISPSPSPQPQHAYKNQNVPTDLFYCGYYSEPRDSLKELTKLDESTKYSINSLLDPFYEYESENNSITSNSNSSFEMESLKSDSISEETISEKSEQSKEDKDNKNGNFNVKNIKWGVLEKICYFELLIDCPVMDGNLTEIMTIPKGNFIGVKAISTGAAKIDIKIPKLNSSVEGIVVFFDGITAKRVEHKDNICQIKYII